MKTTLNVNKVAFEKFKVIKLNRPQDVTNADTFDHVLRVYEDKTHISGSASPMTDATRIVTPSTFTEKMRLDSLKSIKNTKDALTIAYQEDKP